MDWLAFHGGASPLLFNLSKIQKFGIAFSLVAFYAHKVEPPASRDLTGIDSR
jgi:hypothetical protein